MKALLRSASCSREGSALMAVFWLILVVGAAVVMAAKMLNVTQKSMVVRAGQTVALANAWSGVAIGMNPEVQRDDPLLRTDQWNVELQSEDVRINPMAVLQRGDRELLLQMFSAWGMDEDGAEALTDALQDWIDTDDLPGANGAELDYYEEIGRVGQPLNRPFTSLDEMAAVVGMENLAILKPDWRNWFSVFSSGQINLAEADADVIALVGGFNLDDVTTFVSERNGEDGIAGTEDDTQYGSAREAVASVGSTIYDFDTVVGRFSNQGNLVRIKALGASGPARRGVEVVVARRQGQSTIIAELSGD